MLKLKANYKFKQENRVIDAPLGEALNPNDYNCIDWNSETKKVEIIFQNETYIEIQSTVPEILEILNYDCTKEGVNFTEDTFDHQEDEHKQSQYFKTFEEFDMNEVDLKEFCIKAGFIQKEKINLLETVFSGFATIQEDLKELTIIPKEIDYNSIEIEGIQTKDYPDYCDAFVSYAEYKDGTVLTENQMDELNAGEIIIGDPGKYIV